MINLLLAVAVTLLVCMISMPKFRRDAFKKIGLEFEENSDGSKVAAAVLSVVTLYASSWLLGWPLTIIFGACLFLYLSQSDRDSLFNGLLAVLRKIRDAVSGNGGTQSPGLPVRPTPPVTTMPVPPRPTVPTAPAPQPAPRPASKLGTALAKGQRIPLVTNEPNVICVHIGADHLSSANNSLSVSCTLVGANGQVLDYVSVDKRDSNDPKHCLLHTGESGHIAVSLPHVPAEVQSLVFAAISRDRPFRLVDSAVLQVADNLHRTNGVCYYDLPRDSEKPAIIACRIYRHGGGWKIHAIGDNYAASSVTDLAADIAKLV